MRLSVINTGYFKLDNLLNNSTTAAHEYGHTKIVPIVAVGLAGVVSAARFAGFHLEWEFAQNAIESLACDGHLLRWPLSFLASVIVFDMSF